MILLLYDARASAMCACGSTMCTSMMLSKASLLFHLSADLYRVHFHMVLSEDLFLLFFYLSGLCSCVLLSHVLVQGRKA